MKQRNRRKKMGAMALDFAALSATQPVGMPPVTQPQRVEMAGWAKRIWLLLYCEGGLWTSAEIRTQLKVGSAVTTTLGEMVRENFLVRNRARTVDGDLAVKYSVSNKCKVPRGVVIEEIEALLQLAVRNGKPNSDIGRQEVMA
jgi:hypothetical protein